MTNSATSGSGNAQTQGVISQTSVTTQQTAKVQQGQGSTGNSVNLTVGVDTSNQGQATAASGNASATGMNGSTSFNATLTTAASSGQTSSAAPGTATASSTQSQTASGAPTSAITAAVSVVASTSATATSGGATAVGVNAQTNITGNQAVVVHIPANTSGQTVHVTLDATVQNTGTATSQSGNAKATALQTGALGSGSQPASNTSPPVVNTNGAQPGTNRVDVRDVNYALAESGDAMAIGVKADTVINGLQQVLVIIDDNSSGNRIIITFQVSVTNTGTATAITGSTAALGRNGSLQTPDGATSGSLTVGNNAAALTGSATAIGVQSNTAIGVNQDVVLQAGQNSNDNEVDVDFEAAVANAGLANAQSGDSQALAQAGDVGTQPSTSTSRTNTLSTAAVAMASTGATDATGVVAGTTLNEQQPVLVTVNNNNALPIAITQNDRVINLGFANSQSGAATVIAQVGPPETPQTSPPSASAPPVPEASAPASSSPTVFRVANPPNFTVSVASLAAPAAAEAVPAPPESQVEAAVSPAVETLAAAPDPHPAAPAPIAPSAHLQPVLSQQAGAAGDAAEVAPPASVYSMMLVSAGDLAFGKPVVQSPVESTPPPAPEPSPQPTIPSFPVWSLAATIPAILALVRGRRSL